MAAGIPVSYQENGWLKHFFRILGVLALMGGIALAAFVSDGGLPGVIVGGLGVCLLAANEVRAARQKAAERWVLDTGCGFRWLGGPAEIEVQDSQVTAVRIKRTSKFSAGILKGIVRRFEVWTAGAPGGIPSMLGRGRGRDRGREKPLCMTNRIPVNGTDSLAALIVRVIDDLKQRTAAGLAGGAMLEGEGWRLVAMELSITRGRTVESLPFAEIDKVAVFDGKLCLWRRGQDEPAARISPDSKNAPVLASLTTEWIEHQRQGSGAASSATSAVSGMGRLLFARRRNEGFWLGFMAAVVGSAAGMFLLFQHHAWPVGLFLLIAAAAAVLLGAVFGRCLFRCYELGLIRRRGANEFRLLYDEIVEFTYSATRMFYKGAYTGTQLILTFRAPRGTIRYAAKVQNMDADLDELRDHVAKTIANRMLRDLRAGCSVPWMGDVVFLPQGLQFRRSKMLGLASGPIEVLPYEQIRGVNLDGGLFSLYSKAEAKAVISKPVNSANFFPGYAVVLKLLS